MQFVIVATHGPELCPTSNGKIRELMRQSGAEIPELAQRLGVEIITLNFLGPDHEIVAVVEAADIGPVRDFVMQSRLAQWNTVTIRASWSIEDVLERADVLPVLF